MFAAETTKRFWSSYRELLKLGLPVLIAQMGNVFVNMVDTMMVGAYGTDELASAAFVNSIIIVPAVMQMGFSNGLIPIAGAFFGAKKHLEAGETLRVGMQLNFLLGVIMTLLLGGLYFFLDDFGQAPELMPLVKPYYLLALISIVGGGIFFPLSQMCNAVNNTSTPMWIIIGANLLNVFGNWVLIFGELGAPELGLFGAGLSTALARVLSLVAIIWAMLAMKRYRPYREGLFRAKPLTELRRKLLATSWPIMVQCGIECALWAIGAVVCGTFHKNQLAGYQIINTISNMGFLAYSSFANAVAIKVANYSGTHDYSEVRATARRGFRLVVVLATFISVIFLILGKPLVHMFTSDPAVMVCALALLLPMILYQYGDAIQVNYVNALRGTGQVMPLVWISLGCYGGIGVAAIFLLAVVAGLESIGVYISFSVALFSAAFFLNRAFNRAVRTQESKGR